MTLKQNLYRRAFRALERFGFHVTPDHFYSPIPNTRMLQQSQFEQTLFDVGIDLPAEVFEKFAEEIVASYRDEYERFPAESDGNVTHYFRNNGMLTGADAAVYYALIRSRRPKQIIEIGSGYSTLVAAQAVRKNSEVGVGCNCNLTAIEPYPRPWLARGIPGLTQLIRKTVQEVPLDQFKKLGDGDIVFIDSSHVAKIGSDLLQEIFQIIPHLAPGVLVHFHDIFLPFDYNARYLKDHLCFWNENYVLGAFLMFNSCFSVLWPAQLMHRNYTNVMKKTFSFYDENEHNPTSFWIQRNA